MPIGELVVSIIGDMSKLSGTFSAAATEVGNFGSKISNVGQSLSSTGSALTSGISVPLVAVGAGIGATMSKATEFDTGMRRVATMLPEITQSGFQNISNQALTLSKDFGSSTSDMTNAMYQALSSGVPEQNIFTFMQDAEKLAIGGSTDVVTATDVLTNAVNSYGSANLSTAQASDILFQGTKFGKSTVEELAGSLSNVVPVAASMGISFADVNASLATMTIQGTPTAQATTQLRAIMDELSNPTTKASMAFKDLSGKSFPDFIKAGGTVGGAIDILNKGVGKTVPDMKLLAAAEEELKNPTSAMATNFQQVAGKSFPDFIKGGTFQHWAGVSPYTSSFDFAETCVFAKQ
ncbi:MAG: phage tail tape measure protein, partial [Methanosarcina sp.]|nr:phage tail tape measure protein [Methanosarcina sp.]